MSHLNARVRLDTLLFAIAFLALAFGGLRTWGYALAHRPSPSARLARSLLDARSGRPGQGLPTEDTLFTFGLAASAFAGSHFVRNRGR